MQKISNHLELIKAQPDKTESEAGRAKVQRDTQIAKSVRSTRVSESICVAAADGIPKHGRAKVQKQEWLLKWL
jgi:hypothetical protein